MSAAGATAAGQAISAEDAWEIHRLLERYSWALGRGHFAALAALFTADGLVELPEEQVAFGGDHDTGLTDLAFHWLHHADSPGRQWWPSNVLVDVDGDTARVESFLAVPSIVLSALMEGSHFAFLGRVADELVRGADGWRFARRTIRSWDGSIAPAVRGDGPVDTIGDLTAAPGEVGVVDRLAIEDHCADYAWSIDHGDVEGAVATFESSGMITDPDVSKSGTEGLRAFFTNLFTDFTDYTGRTHWIGPADLSIDGDVVAGRSFCLVLQRPAYGGSAGLQLVMEYDDRLVRTEAGWSFTERDIYTWLGRDEDEVARLPRYRVL